MDDRFRQIFHESCRKAGFSDGQIEELEKKVAENALNFAVANIFRVLGERANKDETEKLKRQYEDEVKIKSETFSTAEMLEYVKRVFNKYVKEEEIEKITIDAIYSEYSLTADNILKLLKEKG